MKIKKIAYFVVLGVIILIASCVNGKVLNEEKIVWKYGVAVIDGQPRYIDYEKLDQTEMFYDKNYIKYIKTNTIEAIRIVWVSKERFFTYNTTKSDTGGYLTNTEKIYYYKIENDNLYVSLDKNEWDKLIITIVDENPKQVKNEPKNFNPPVFIIIHLKCKWFEGQYELVGTTG